MHILVIGHSLFIIHDFIELLFINCYVLPVAYCLLPAASCKLIAYYLFYLWVA